MQSLIFFNKEGDNLNFTYNNSRERWEGDLLFHENSDDTFKTIGLYTFERIAAFDYENPGNLNLKKFQLFNEYRFTFNGNSNFTQSIQKIELPNTDPNFYSKWIYGDNFESKFPKGSQIVFNEAIFEFTNIRQSYTVVGTKKNAILIIGNVDNKSFDNDYAIPLTLTASYQNKSISGLNTIGFYDYLYPDFREKYSSWSEPDFYDRLYNDRKFNVLRTSKNDGIYTVKSKDIYDRVYFGYELPKSSFTQSGDLTVRATFKTDLPLVYTGGLKADGYRLYFKSRVPQVLKPGREFILPRSNVNSNFLVVDYVPEFLGKVNLTYYGEGYQVMWNNLIYECIQSYTWSGTSSINPDNNEYWSKPKYLPVTTELVPEEILFGEVHLSTNIIQWVQPFTQSNVITLNSWIEKYKSELNFFDLDTYYKSSSLHVDLIYPSDYCKIEFYNSVSPGQDLANFKKIYERSVQTEELLKSEINKNINQNFRYNIVFTDLDEYGLIIKIGKQVYSQEIQWVYEGSILNPQRTIDKTIRKWYANWYIPLFTIGIKPVIGFTGKLTSIYFNTISLTTVYPNVPLDFTVEVGTTADFYIEHTEIIFKDISNYLSLNINDRSYDISVATFSAQNFDIDTTLQNWIDDYQDTLNDFGIYVVNSNNVLSFRTKEQDQRLEIIVNVGKSGLPAEELYIIRPKYLGKFGALVTSNEIILPGTYDVISGSPSVVDTFPATWSFEDESFATGQVVGINNTLYPWNNQEYNILSLEPQSIILGYQGPFWSTIDPKCEISPYVIVGFDTGFGSSGCIKVDPPIIVSGEFDLSQYSTAFNLEIDLTNTYEVGLNYGISGNDNLTDLIYINLTDNIYILGNKITVIDANLGVTKDTIDIPGLTGPVSLALNPVNQRIYCLTKDTIYTVDPYLDILINTFTISQIPKKMEFNLINGDLYLSYDSSPKIDIWSYNNFTPTPTTTLNLSGNVLDMVYHESEQDMYVSQADNSLIRVKGSTRAPYINYPIDGLTGSLFYETSESSIWLFDNLGIRKINNGLSYSFGIANATGQDYFVYNNTENHIVLSQPTGFQSISLEGVLLKSVSTSDYGPMVVNQYDGDVYLASQVIGELKVLDTVNGSYKWAQGFSGIIKKIVYNPSRTSVFGIVPSKTSVFENGSLLELKVSLDATISQNIPDSIKVEENLYGTLAPDYTRKQSTWLKVREYIRKPRENYNDDVQVQLIWKWVDDQVPEMFLYDFSGDQLRDVSSYSYIGPKPLTTVSLNNKPNRDITKIAVPEYQQTIFDELIMTLDYIDSESNYKSAPEPMEVFIGFNSKNEGPIQSELKLYKRESIEFTIKTTSANLDIIQFTNRSDGLCAIYLNSNSETSFIYDSTGKNRGLKNGQVIELTVTDNTNLKNKYVSLNYGVQIKITHIFNKTLLGTPVNTTLTDEFTKIDDYPKLGKSTYLTTKFKVLDYEIGSFTVYGQTEIEDIRYKIELSNNGQIVSTEDTYIFKSYDINEQGIDWTYLNKKRMEMLMVRDQIYPFIGSYKAIINAINYFGYNDLELYEYYRNINVDSKDFEKLFKIEIPDIFDNTVEGWTPNDFIKHTMPNPNFEETNLFNLTYKITDKEGTNVLLYSLAEVIIKLQGLKYWLETNIIPLTHKILDITGRADFVGSTTIQHRNYYTKIINVQQDFSPVDFSISEAYLMPVNSGSTVYTCNLDFIVASASIGPEYFSVKIRTYQTHPEWDPFIYYDKRDKVQYYQQIYESVIDNNRLFNPRKYEDVKPWTEDVDYVLGDYVDYNRYIYQYIGTQSSFIVFGSQSITPLKDILTNQAFASWIDMTEWKKSDYLPVQTINEFRTATHSYIFTVDSNLDPFVVVEVTSDNGYGQIYTSKKNYEIRGTKDLTLPAGIKDIMGPFIPIVPVIDTLGSIGMPIGPPVVNIAFPNLGTIQGGQATSQVLNADRAILIWEIVDENIVDCTITIEFLPQSQKNKIQLRVKADESSVSGLFSFRVKMVSDDLLRTVGYSDIIYGNVSAVPCLDVIYMAQGVSLSGNLGQFESDLNIGGIANGATSAVIASIGDLRPEAKSEWEIVNVSTMTDITIGFLTNNDTTCIALVEVEPNSPSGTFSFQLKSTFNLNPSCVRYSGIIRGQVSNVALPPNFYKSKLTVQSRVGTTYNPDPTTLENSYVTPPFEELKTSNGYTVEYIVTSFFSRDCLFIITPHFIQSIELTLYQNIFSINQIDTWDITIDNDGVTQFTPTWKAKIEFSTNGNPIHIPPSSFTLKVYFTE